MLNKKINVLIILIILGLSTVNMSCEKAQKTNLNKSKISKVDEFNNENKEKDEKVKIIKVEDITNLFSNDKYGFVFEKIELENKETHYIGKCKDPECFGLLDLSGENNLQFLKYSMAISEDEKINNNSFNKMVDLSKMICPSFKDFPTWIKKLEENIKEIETREASYNGFNISFGKEENTGALVLKIVKKSN